MTSRIENSNIVLTKLREEDRTELEKFFFAVINDTFTQDGVGSRTQAIQSEVRKNMEFLDEALKHKGSDVYYLLARNENQIVGIIAYSKPSDLIKKYLQEDLQNIPEIRTVYILPEFQGKGLGSLLFNTMFKSLLKKNVAAICLDGGYKKSQGFWIKKLGEPNVILKDHYGKGLDYMIWYRNLKDLVNK